MGKLGVLRTESNIVAIIILQIDGRRALANYYDSSINQKQFEKHLYSKTKTPKAKDEIISLDGYTIVHKFITDSHIYVVSNRNENCVIQDYILDCLAELVRTLPTNNSGSNTVQDNLNKFILAFNEMSDNGHILEIDPYLIKQRITVTNEDSVESMAQRTARRIFGI